MVPQVEQSGARAQLDFWIINRRSQVESRCRVSLLSWVLTGDLLARVDRLWV
jgi:hypothetical protein